MSGRAPAAAPPGTHSIRKNHRSLPIASTPLNPISSILLLHPPSRPLPLPSSPPTCYPPPELNPPRSPPPSRADGWRHRRRRRCDRRRPRTGGGVRCGAGRIGIEEDEEGG
eukprot:2592269-Pyramimonas_sp.AAC.1